MVEFNFSFAFFLWNVNAKIALAVRPVQEEDDAGKLRALSGLQLPDRANQTQPKMVRSYFKTVLDLSNWSDEVLLISPSTWMTATTAGGKEGGRAEEVEDVSG